MNSANCQLWMGNLVPNMTEDFIMAAFQKMGEHPHNVKEMRNKYTGEPATYCFVYFCTDMEAINAMHKLNGKPIPGTNPVIRFCLDKAKASTEKEFTLWVGELTSDVDDYSLYKVFSRKYSSIKTAKVVLDTAGFCKGYGFVRFSSEDDQKHALSAMNGYSGLGSKSLRVCRAIHKQKGATNGSSSDGNVQQFNTVPTEYSQQQYYDPSAYWQNYSSAWSGYYGAGQGGDQGTEDPQDATPDTSHPPPAAVDRNLVLTDHKTPLDVEQMNREAIEKDRTLWDGIDSARWLPADIMEVY